MKLLNRFKEEWEENKKGNKKNLLPLFFASALALFSQLTQIKDFLADILRFEVLLIDAILLIALSSVFLYLSNEKNRETKSYSYNFRIRVLLKIFSAAIFILFVSKIYNLWLNHVPLDSNIYGYVYDQNNKPIAKAKVLIKSTAHFFTQESYPTDNSGFFMLSPGFKVYYTDSLVIKLETCNQDYILPLSKDYRIKDSTHKSSLVFQYQINLCPN